MAYDMSGKAFHDRRAKELREAYEVLSDEEKRKEYDKEQEKTVLTMEELYEKIERETPRTRVDDLIDQGQKDPLGLFIMIVAMFFLALITHVMEN